jgi:hypothetical protein
MASAGGPATPAIPTTTPRRGAALFEEAAKAGEAEIEKQTTTLAVTFATLKELQKLHKNLTEQLKNTTEANKREKDDLEAATYLKTAELELARRELASQVTALELQSETASAAQRSSIAIKDRLIEALEGERDNLQSSVLQKEATMASHENAAASLRGQIDANEAHIDRIIGLIKGINKAAERKANAYTLNGDFENILGKLEVVTTIDDFINNIKTVKLFTDLT